MKHLYKKITLLLVLILVLSACAPAAKTAEEYERLQETAQALARLKQLELMGVVFDPGRVREAFSDELEALGDVEQQLYPVSNVELITVEQKEEFGSYTVSEFSDFPWERIADYANFGDPHLLKAAYDVCKTPRGSNGMPVIEGDETGVKCPWQYIAAITYGETNTEAWDPNTLDVRQPGPWGYQQAYNTCFMSGELYSPSLNKKNQEGLDRIAAYLKQKYPNKYATLTGDQIYTSSACAVGKTQVLASHFAKGGIYEHVIDLDVWNSKHAIAEVAAIHIMRKASKCGEGYYYTQDFMAALCNYNPGAWGVAKYQWYFDGIDQKGKEIERAFIMVASEETEMMSSGYPRLSWPGNSSTYITGYVFGSYSPNYADGFHRGMDIYGGPAALAVCSGTITYADTDWAVNGIVVLQCDEHYWPGHIITVKYMHMYPSSYAKYGTYVNAHFTEGAALADLAPGDDCGEYCGGVHIHFEILVDGAYKNPQLFWNNAIP